MKEKISIELTEDELRDVLEMTAFAQTLSELVKNDHLAIGADKWQRTSAELFDQARKAPALSRHISFHSELLQYFFKKKYAERAHYSVFLEELREGMFWTELVQRMADHTLAHALPVEEYESLSDEERGLRVASLERALWEEVERHGLDRLAFLLDEEDS